jgi:hypothetical protein
LCTLEHVLLSLHFPENDMKQHTRPASAGPPAFAAVTNPSEPGIACSTTSALCGLLLAIS